MHFVFLLFFLQADDKKDLKVSVEKMKKVKSYEYRVTSVNGADKSVFDGEYVDGALHLRSEKGELARKGGTKLHKPKDGEWKELPRIGRGELADAVEPHDWVEKMVALVPALKKERSEKVQGVTTDVYVFSLEAMAAKGAFEAAGLPFLGGLWVDWTQTKNGLLFYVGRDDLVYRVEQRLSGKTKDKKPVTVTVTLDFSRFNQAKLNVPEDVRAKLK